MKIKNNPNKRQEHIIKYLNEHGEVTTEEIKTRFKIAKSTLSEDIKFLRSIGYPIVSRYGYISLQKSPDTANIPYYEKLCPALIRKWIICYVAVNLYNPYFPSNELNNLEELEHLCNKFYKLLSPNTTAMSTYVFHKDIKALMAEGFLEYDRYTIRLLQRDKFLKNSLKNIFYKAKAPRMSCLNLKYCQYLLSLLENDTDALLFSDFVKRLRTFFPKLKSSQMYSEENFYTTTTPDQVDKFYKLPFKSKCLNITCLNKEEADRPITYKEFETGAMIYSMDKMRFYLLGKASNQNYHLIPMDSVTDIQETDEENTLYNSEEIQNACSHLLCASLDHNSIEPTKVSFLIINTPENQAILQRVLDSRKPHASLSDPYTAREDCTLNPDMVKQYGVVEYSDTIIGKTDLLPFILSFRNQLQVLYPGDIAEMVNQENLRLLKRYQETFEFEYKENIHECL